MLQKPAFAFSMLAVESDIFHDERLVRSEHTDRQFHVKASLSVLDKAESNKQNAEHKRAKQAKSSKPINSSLNQQPAQTTMLLAQQN